MSLRTKIVLALLLTSLASVTLVGVVAYQRVVTRFTDMHLAGARDSFRANVQAYVQTYGSWDAGAAAEPFAAFSQRRMGGGPGRPGRRPPQENGAGPGMGSPGAQLDGPAQSERRTAPPIQFLVFTPDGVALTRTPAYAIGDHVSTDDQAGAEPLRVDGRLIGYFHPEGQVNFSAPELRFVGVARDALLGACALAAILAVGAGLVIGRRLSRPLRRLTDAARAMQAGDLGQRVAVNGRDEIAILAQAFNHMAEALARDAARLREISIRDGLTQLHNRVHFDEQARMLYQRAVREGRPLSLMIGDIDHFKAINDRYSHAIGDAVLRQVADLLRAALRPGDLAARYGGEEFVMLLQDTGAAEAAALCERLRQAIAAADWQEIHPDLAVTISIGVSGDLGQDGPDGMIAAADARLYQAKADGRNRVCAA
ncbi:GGDEF domain-containing protein [Nitrospirillum iridis]|uniref:diguanylate cyclase n=1 Tax=Nitrospirillum iridis TaxID=765888 RepID=A0A7X0B439_9PROT|nr:GGDEF domain-containing protein [Nitrospirillum iridis]MBB6254335.1 diguanylate cyclase (GGDEF)-like protein [Nitrospirillum iridis]